MELSVQELLDKLREKYLKEECEDKKEKLLNDIFIIHSRRNEIFYGKVGEDFLEAKYKVFKGK